MALNSTFVINRMGLATCEAGNRSMVEPMDETYTSSRLGLTFAGHDQPISPPLETHEPPQEPPLDGKSLDSRLGISPDSKTDPTTQKVRKPFWPKFRSAAAMLSIAVKNGILGKLVPHPKPDAEKEAADDFRSHPAQCPSPKAEASDPSVVYRKGTYKLPAELMARLKSCAAVDHRYQYRLVIESLDGFLTAKGFAHESETESNPTE